MALTRIVDTDDSGSGTDGTLHNNAWLQTLNLSIDARWSEITVTSTGSQNNLSITSGGIEADVIVCANATDLTITGIAAPASPAKPGKRLAILALGTGNVFLSYESGSSSAANRLRNFASSAATPLCAGIGRAYYVYDTVIAEWVLVSHEQGAPIAPTFADSSYNGDGTDGNWALASGDVTTQTYYLKGRQVFVDWFLATTTVANTPASLRIANTAWGGFTAARTKLRPCVYNDNGGGNTVGFAQATAAGTVITIQKLTGGTFANATNATSAFGDLSFEVS